MNTKKHNKPIHVIINNIEFLDNSKTAGIINMSTEHFSTVVDAFTIRRDGKLVFFKEGLYSDSDIKYLEETILSARNQKVNNDAYRK